MTVRRAAFIGMVGVGLFVGAVLALHLLPTGLNPIQRTVSEYVNQPYGWLVPVAGAGIGIGSLAIASALTDTPARVGLSLLVVFGAAMLVVAAFPTDPAPPGRPVHLTPTGTVHVVAGAVAFLALAVGAPVLSRAIPDRTVRILGWLAPVGLLLFIDSAYNRPPVSKLVGEPNAWGLGERIMVAIYVAWLLSAAAWSYRQSGRRTPTA